MGFITFLRQYRIFNFAIFDLTLAFLGMYLIAPLLSRLMRMIGVNVPEINWVILALPIGVIVHLLLHTMTPMTKNFIDPSDHIILKIVIIVLFILGLQGVSLIK